ncbi:MAG: D-alanyl-D-alanine carboxypeptidase, partial [Clostridiales bacterium]|nr:D-alanyl-D-alanine carboxypeptidase [Clostridiales bacterium]
MILILIAGLQIPATAAPMTSAAADILIEASSGTVLHEKNADKHMRIASTTKILPGIVVLENCGVNDKVLIGNDFPAIEGSSIYLKHGEELTVLSLLYGLLLESGNDAAVALAIHTAGSVEAFADLMNRYAESLGCRNSCFKNPHGLDHEGHYSTARDLALISAAAMENKTFRDIVSTKHIALDGRYYKNHNKLLWMCPGAIGIKTGYTKSSGRSLVSCTERDGMRLVCVTLSAPDDWDDHTNLYNWAYRNYDFLSVAGAQTYGEIPVISGLKQSVSVRPAEEYYYVYNRADKTELTREIPEFVYAPVGKNEIAGMITIKKNGETIKEIPLVFGDSVALDNTI